MLDKGETIFIFLGCIVLLYLILRKRPHKYPPGSKGLPIIGSLPFLMPHMGEILLDWRKKFGSIFYVQIGLQDWIVLDDIDTITECFLKHGKVFSGRPKIPLFERISDGQGLVFRSYTSEFKHQRKFGLQTLRSLGLGKKSIEHRIINEAKYLEKEILSKNEEAIIPRTVLTPAVSNIICSVVFGERFEYDDTEFGEMVCRLSDSTNEPFYGVAVGLMSIMFGLRHLPFFSSIIKRLDADAEYIKNIIKCKIEKHKEAYNEENLHDFIDHFHFEMRKNDCHESFNEHQLLLYVKDLFVAGTETVSTTLNWCLLAFLHFPKYQTMISEEIQSVIGNREPSMEDKASMHFTCAFIEEIMRHRTISIFALQHMVTEDVEVLGYKIPKNSVVVANLWGIAHDPRNFSEPKKFDPSRYLNEEGLFEKQQKSIPFGIGPRYCLGQHLAQVEIFLFLCSLVQRFEMFPDDNSKLPDFNDGLIGITYFPKEYKVKFIER